MKTEAQSGSHKDVEQFSPKNLVAHVNGSQFNGNDSIARDFSKVDAGRNAVDEHKGHPHQGGDFTHGAAASMRGAAGQRPFGDPKSPMAGK